MNRKSEKYLLTAAALWNLLTAAITIFGYAGWFREEGLSRFEANGELSYFSSSMLDSLVSVVMIFGLFILTIGIVNLVIARNIAKLQLDKRVKWWLITCVAIHLLCFDLLGVLLYLLTTVIYCARNKSLKINLETQ